MVRTEKQSRVRTAGLLSSRGKFSATFSIALSTFIANTSPAETVTYYYTDLQGTVLATTDALANILDKSDRRPYGEQIMGSTQSGPVYTGHVEDPDSGLIYMQQRYYDPQMGRFLSGDPVRANASPDTHFNRYWYANDNPYMFTDPDGRETYVLYKLPNQDVNTIVTDGKGGIELHLGNTGGMGRIVLQGVTLHEGSHRTDFYKNCDKTCGILKDAPAGLAIGIDGPADAAASEVRASNTEIDYLKGEKNKARNRDEKPAIERRSVQMTQYRDANQKIVDQSEAQKQQQEQEKQQQQQQQGVR